MAKYDPETQAVQGERAATSCFKVFIDDNSLGYFSSCEGLGVEVVMEQREEGGSNNFVWQLPTRIKFTNVKVSRPVSTLTPEVMQWFADMVQKGVVPTTATISARTFDDDIVAQWTLIGVVPVRWSGPSLNLDSPKVAFETLELAYHGISPIVVAS